MQLNIFLHEIVKEENGMTYISSLLPITNQNLEIAKNLLQREINLENMYSPLIIDIVSDQLCYRFEGKLNGFTTRYI